MQRTPLSTTATKPQREEPRSSPTSQSSTPPVSSARPQATDSLPPYSSVDSLPPYSSVDLELDHDRPPLNSFEVALRSAIAEQSDPPPPSEVDMSQYEDLFVFKDIDKEDQGDD